MTLILDFSVFTEIFFSYLSGEDNTNNSMVSDGFTDILIVKTHDKNSANSIVTAVWMRLCCLCWT